MSVDKGSTRVLLLSIARALLATTLIVVAYFLLPLERLGDVSPAVTLPLAVTGFALVVAVQVRSILRARYPGLRAVEALGTSVPLLLVVFAGTYVVMSTSTPGAFTEDMSKLDALYFSLTTLATVGFGDIAAATPPARLAVTIQMAADLVVVGLGLRIILGAVQEARHRHGEPPARM